MMEYDPETGHSWVVDVQPEDDDLPPNLELDQLSLSDEDVLPSNMGELGTNLPNSMVVRGFHQRRSRCLPRKGACLTAVPSPAAARPRPLRGTSARQAAPQLPHMRPRVRHLCNIVCFFVVAEAQPAPPPKCILQWAWAINSGVWTSHTTARGLLKTFTSNPSRDAAVDSWLKPVTTPT